MNNTKRNRTMLIDFYEFTMANGYFNSKLKDKTVYFDMSFRKIPDEGGYAIFAGLGSIIKYIENFEFTQEDLQYLKNQNLFSDDFIEYLKNFKFSGDIYCVKEGTVIFPNEPVLTIKANLVEAQLLETYLLLCFNHQSLIATKSSRIKRAAKGRTVLEMGARRAHGVSSANNGSRAAYIAGIDATSNTLADCLYGIPCSGTMAHSWVQMFDTEEEAFREYVKTYPNNATLLVDTYNTLKSGIPNAIKVIKEELLPKNINNFAIRIDSGDLTYLSKQSRKMLDDAGLSMCKIVVSNALDEYLIEALLNQGAPIDIFGVGERLVTAKSNPVFGGIYKLCAIESEENVITPKIKISDNPVKITTPHFKKLYRIYDKDTKKAKADLITVYDEKIDENKPLTIFDPEHTWKTKTFEEFTIKDIKETIYKNGKLVYKVPTLKQIREHAKQEQESLWDEVLRFDNPHKYYVDLSEKLWQIKLDLIKKSKKSI
ncbi:nicotinate phosphoribosyltransferase [Arcobacter sp. CECT 8985]|uniref:nicotinate phosphoribosyltransferase n=1 Tax=Arcobacter sp. CECT 8985 TaxID=1935424 RepID=UPI00100BA679|nr:nicotinate phosphoribosyltransferase [Arcobacter sp. CECT 8985]RXJ87326.1 nicotinate phosphoribosyltransferase [Arcobacter sp. CECT 8985]